MLQASTVNLSLLLLNPVAVSFALAAKSVTTLKFIKVRCNYIAVILLFLLFLIIVRGLLLQTRLGGLLPNFIAHIKVLYIVYFWAESEYN